MGRRKQSRAMLLGHLTTQDIRDAQALLQKNTIGTWWCPRCRRKFYLVGETAAGGLILPDVCDECRGSDG